MMGESWADDPRIDPRIKAVFGAVPVTVMPDLPSRAAWLEVFAAAAAAGGEPPVSVMSVLASIDFEPLSPKAGLEIRTKSIASAPDGNRINLQIITPPGDGPWPCVYYIHGGGMAALSCFDGNYSAWGRMIARQGVKVVMVDFRNALRPSSVPEVAPFPAGLNDCVSGFRWVRDNAVALDVDPGRIVIAGESGGGNLAVATALMLKRGGDLSALTGLFVLCPYLAGDWPGGPGSSALENAGILMDARGRFGAMMYGIEQWEKRNPLAWPGFATAEDLAGFPPVMINVNELDPLRDDGVGLYRTLLAAGVSARCRQLMGTVHGTEVFLCCPDISLDVAREIAGFAQRTAC